MLPIALRASLVLQAMTFLGLGLGSAACSEPDRTFAEGNGGAGTGTGTATGPTSGTEAGSTGASGGAGPGGGGGGPSSTAAGELCGNGEVDEIAGEECDEVSGICEGCLFTCPDGWFREGESCFSVALGDVINVDGLEGLARCGALDVAGLGRRAHPATPSTAAQFATLAASCPANGCWLGYLALEEPSTSNFAAPSTGDVLFAEAPWSPGQPSRGVREVCTRLLSTGGADPQPMLEDADCISVTAYSACELELSWGSMEGCGDGTVNGDEECDGDATDGTCVDCNRVCLVDELEDPRTHACLFAAKSPIPFSEAADACSSLHDGGSRATPDEIADVRILQLVGPGWLGLQASPEPTWASGEPFTYDVGFYPLAAGEPLKGTVGRLDEDGLIAWTLPSQDVLFPALCDVHQP